MTMRSAPPSISPPRSTHRRNRPADEHEQPGADGRAAARGRRRTGPRRRARARDAPRPVVRRWRRPTAPRSPSGDRHRDRAESRDRETWRGAATRSDYTGGRARHAAVSAGSIHVQPGRSGQITDPIVARLVPKAALDVKRRGPRTTFRQRQVLDDAKWFGVDELCLVHRFQRRSSPPAETAPAGREDGIGIERQRDRAEPLLPWRIDVHLRFRGHVDEQGQSVLVSAATRR